jgi:HlyD family secretion protein
MKTKITRGKKMILLISSLVIISMVAFTVFWSGKADSSDYLTAKIQRGNIRNTVAAVGTLQALTTVQVGSQVSGTIQSLFADFNSIVKKGQIVAQLDPSIFQAQVAQARANLEQAKANLVDAKARLSAAESTVENQQAGVNSANANLAVLKAQSDDAKSLYNRQKLLVEKGLIADRDLESALASANAAEARYNQAKAQLEQAKVSAQSAANSGLAQARAQVQQAEAQIQQSTASLQLAEINLSHTTIASPIDGIVVSRNVDVGQTVAASLQAPTIFTIANDLRKMQIIASIDQADIGAINESEAINFTVDAFPGQNFSGKIRQIRVDAQNVQNVVTYNVVIDVDNPDLKLKPGMTANLVITVAEATDTLKVPNAALRFTPQGMTRDKIRELLGGEKKDSSAEKYASGKGSKTDSGKDSKTEERRSETATTAILQGQTRILWTMDTNKELKPHRVKLGITDGVSTEIVTNDLKENDVIIIGQNTPTTTQTNSTTTRFPGGGTGGGFGGGGSRR